MSSSDSGHSDSGHSSRLFFSERTHSRRDDFRADAAAVAAEEEEEEDGADGDEEYDGEEEDEREEDGEEEDVESEDDGEEEDAIITVADVYALLSATEADAPFPNSKRVDVPTGFTVDYRGWNFPGQEAETETLLSHDLTVVGFAAAKANHNARMSRADQETDLIKWTLVREGAVMLETEDYHSVASSSSSPFVFGVNPECIPLSRLTRCMTFKIRIGCHLDGLLYLWMFDLHKYGGSNVKVEVPFEDVKKFLEERMALYPDKRPFSIVVVKSPTVSEAEAAEEDRAAIRRIRRTKAQRRRNRRRSTKKRR